MGFSAIAGGVASAAVGSLLSDDSGASEANAAAASANQASAEASKMQAQISREQWDRYKELYAPLEAEMVADAKNYDSADNYAKAAGEASAIVGSQFGKAKSRLGRTPGMDPSSAGYQHAMVGLDLAQAATDATQQNMARQRVTDTAYTRKQTMLGMGKGLDSAAASGLASVAGQQAGLANAAQRQAEVASARSSSQAQAAGSVIGRVFNNPAVSSGINNAVSGWFGGGAGSSNFGGSVQGNPDYIYDL